MDPMDVEYDGFTEEDIKECVKNMKSTVFPSNEFGTVERGDDDERTKFALKHHKEYGAKTLDELCTMLAKIHLKFRYCAWCNEYDTSKRLIIEHLHIKGKAGKYRGCLCHNCNMIERDIKEEVPQKKVKILFERIEKQVPYIDKEWCVRCVMLWYPNDGLSYYEYERPKNHKIIY